MLRRKQVGGVLVGGNKTETGNCRLLKSKPAVLYNI